MVFFFETVYQPTILFSLVLISNSQLSISRQGKRSCGMTRENPVPCTFDWTTATCDELPNSVNPTNNIGNYTSHYWRISWVVLCILDCNSSLNHLSTIPPSLTFKGAATSCIIPSLLHQGICYVCYIICQCVLLVVASRHRCMRKYLLSQNYYISATVLQSAPSLTKFQSLSTCQVPVAVLKKIAQLLSNITITYILATSYKPHDACSSTPLQKRA